jgi:hypothetical protein
MPPRAVWKIRLSGVVPNLLTCARSSRTRTGGMGMVRVSLSARCFRPRSWRAVPSSVQARPGPGRRGRKDDPPPPGSRQVQVVLSQHDLWVPKTYATRRYS